jgi:hypothetical protein
MVLILQVFFILVMIIVIILFVFRITRAKKLFSLPENSEELLQDYVKFYRHLDEPGKESFKKRVEQFLSSVRITGVNAMVEDMDLLFIGAAAVIPVYHIPDWQYVNLHEVLVYPGSFNTDFDQAGPERTITGMVGAGAMQHVMIITKWELRQGFIDNISTSNTAIHEFVHLIDKMDGTLDGIPEIILERKYAERWKSLMDFTIRQMNSQPSDINLYATTNHAEFFAVISEYFFEQPGLLEANHPDLYEMLGRIFKTGK